MLSNAPSKIPVLILTGFLGSGKTTLLNRLLNDGTITAVVINEFGDTPVDQDLLQTQTISLTVLSGGCLCCKVKGALAPTLKNLWMAWHNAASKPFERIIIEASGVASPEPILDTLLREPWLSKHYHLQRIVTTLAIPQASEQLQRFAEVQAQLTWADVLILSHADLAQTEQIEALNKQLQDLIPNTPTLLADLTKFDATLLSETTSSLIRRLPSDSDTNTHSFHTVSLYLTQTPAWPHLQSILQNLINQYPSDILRIKGVIFPSDKQQPLAVQASNGQIYPAISLPVRASDDGRSRLVFISTNANEAWLDHLTKYLGKAIDSRSVRKH